MKNNKKIIMIICGLFILLSGFAYINSDAIGKFVYKDDTKYVSYAMSILLSIYYTDILFFILLKIPCLIPGIFIISSIL